MDVFIIFKKQIVEYFSTIMGNKVGESDLDYHVILVESDAFIYMLLVI